MSFYSSFKNHLLTQKIILPGERLALGLSGGLDSTVLLHLLFCLKKEFPLFLVGVHVNYHLRAKASDLDEALLRQMLAKMNLPLEVLSSPLALKSSIQDQARRIRYDYFAKIAAQYRCEKIILAHHAEDQVETFLMRLVRGSGLQGLGAMNQEREFSFDSKLKVIRPLLPFSKEDLRTYARGKKIRWREDASNQKTDYLRNFIRLNFLKPLKKKNPQVLQKISEAIEVVQEENEWMNQYVRKILKGKVKGHSGEFTLPLDWLQKQASPLRKRIYLQLFKEKIPTLTPSRKYLTSLDEMVMGHKTQMKLSFSMGYGAFLQKGALTFVRWRQQKLEKRGFFY